MCIGCFNHLLADARMRDETSTCPNCRTEISKNLSSRNLAVEKAVSELPAQCRFCCNEFSRNTLEKHEKEICEERYEFCFVDLTFLCPKCFLSFRTTLCKFNRIGCQWSGPFHEILVRSSLLIVFINFLMDCFVSRCMSQCVSTLIALEVN